MNLIEYMVRWCKEERVSLSKQLELLETGVMKTRSWSPETKWVDTTQENIETCKRKIAELDDLIESHPELKEYAQRFKR